MSPVEVRAAATVRERDRRARERERGPVSCDFYARPFQAMFKKSSTVAFKGEVRSERVGGCAQVLSALTARIRGKETKALSKAS